MHVSIVTRSPIPQPALLSVLLCMLTFASAFERSSMRCPTQPHRVAVVIKAATPAPGVRLGQTGLFRKLLPSIRHTVLGPRVNLYVHYDEHDPYWPRVQRFIDRHATVLKASSFSEIMRKVLIDNDYIVIVDGDDAQFASNDWASMTISAMQALRPSNIGIVYAQSDKGHNSTMPGWGAGIFCLHRSHFDILGLTFPPPGESAFSLLVELYGPNRSKLVPDWVVRRPHYAPLRPASLRPELVEGLNAERLRLYSWLLRNRENNNVVVSTAIGYGIQDYRAFIFSLRRYYEGDIVLIVVSGGMQRKIADLCRANRVDLHEVNNLKNIYTDR